MSRSPLAVVHTGLHTGPHNAALDRAALEWRARGGYDLLRWHRSAPTASVGRDQAADTALRLEYCRSHAIDVVRRATSGGALYLDAGQLTFSLVLGADTHLQRLRLGPWLAHGAAAIAAGLRFLGIAAERQSFNDVEVDGRKIASVFAARHGDAVLLQGVVLVEPDVETLLKVLRVPTEKLSADGLAAARDRLVGLASCARPGWTVGAVMQRVSAALAASFGRDLRRCGALPEALRKHEATPVDAACRSSWEARAGKVAALARVAGGTLRAWANFEGAEGCLSGVELAADAHLDPAGWVPELARAIDGVAVQAVRARVIDQAHRHGLDAVGVRATDFADLLEQLAEKRRFARACGLDAAAASALMPYSSVPAGGTDALLARATVMLVPYCAKPAWCKWRHRDGCTECGLCEVGAAYRAARERNMQVTTITNYEHLVATLSAMKARGVAAYVGMCCSHFFIKRHRAFAQAGMPALLMDISGSNCYELREEHLAYAGAFKAEARLDGALLQHVMRFVPRQQDGCGNASASRGRISGAE